MAQQTPFETRVWLAVRVFERLGLCALTLVLVWMLWLRHTALARYLENHHARVVSGQSHLDELLAPQALILRTICRGLAASGDWPREVARECDVAVPSPLSPDRTPPIPDLILGESRQAIGG